MTQRIVSIVEVNKMSCKDCEKEIETREKEYYFRIDTGNILIFGCPKHVKMAMNKLRGG